MAGLETRPLWCLPREIHASAAPPVSHPLLPAWDSCLQQHCYGVLAAITILTATRGSVNYMLWSQNIASHRDTRFYGSLWYVRQLTLARAHETPRPFSSLREHNRAIALVLFGLDQIQTEALSGDKRMTTPSSSAQAYIPARPGRSLRTSGKYRAQEQ